MDDAWLSSLFCVEELGWVQDFDADDYLKHIKPRPELQYVDRPRREYIPDVTKKPPVLIAYIGNDIYARRQTSDGGIFITGENQNFDGLIWYSSLQSDGRLYEVRCPKVIFEDVVSGNYTGHNLKCIFDKIDELKKNGIVKFKNPIF